MSPSEPETVEARQLSRIEEAAIAWNAARLSALALRRARADEGCEVESDAEPEVGLPGVPPCWKTYRITYSGDQERVSQAQWCEPCKRREVIHLQYREAVKRRGALMRSLERLTAPARPVSASGGAE